MHGASQKRFAIACGDSARCSSHQNSPPPRAATARVAASTSATTIPTRRAVDRPIGSGDGAPGPGGTGAGGPSGTGVPQVVQTRAPSGRGAEQLAH